MEPPICAPARPRPTSPIVTVLTRRSDLRLNRHRSERNMPSGRFRFALLLAVLAPVLGGCGLLFPPDKPTCPRVSIPADADRLTRFRAGAGRDLTDVRFQ